MKIQLNLAFTVLWLISLFASCIVIFLKNDVGITDIAVIFLVAIWGELRLKAIDDILNKK